MLHGRFQGDFQRSNAVDDFYICVRLRQVRQAAVGQAQRQPRFGFVVGRQVQGSLFPNMLQGVKVLPWMQGSGCSQIVDNAGEHPYQEQVT